MFIKSMPNTVTITSTGAAAQILLPPNDRRIAVVISIHLGTVAIKFGGNPSSASDGIILSVNDSQGFLRTIRLNCHDYGTGIQQQINVFPSAAAIVISATEFIASP